MSIPGSLFIAVKPPSSVIAQLEDLHVSHPNPELLWSSGSRLVAPIRFLGHVDEETAKQTLHTLRTLPIVKGASIGDRAHHYGHDGLFVRVHGLRSMVEAVRDRTGSVGHDETHDRHSRIMIVQCVPGCRRKLPTVSEHFQGHFDVDRLVLMRSRQDRYGRMKYDAVDQVQLGHYCAKCGGDCNC
jgi:2'-5' RNA ligase